MANSFQTGFLRDDATGALIVSGSVPNTGDIVVPFVSPIPGAVSALTSTLRIILLRAVIPKTGTLHDLAIFAGGTQAGNHIGAVYDVGEASAGNVSKLWDSGTVTGLTINTWNILGDPALPVVAGQNVSLAFATDSATATFGRITAGNSPNPWQALPDGFMPQGNDLSIKPACGFTQGALAAPSTIADASLSAPGTAVLPYLIARVA